MGHLVYLGVKISLLLLVFLAGILEGTSFSGPASITFGGPITPDPVCQSALSFGSTLALVDSTDGYRVTGDVAITSVGVATGDAYNCLIYMFFVRTINEPAGSVLSSESSMSGTVDADGPLQLSLGHFDYLTMVSGADNSSACLSNATAPIPGTGTGVAFSAGPILAGTCTISPSRPAPGLQGVLTAFVNDQPGTLTFHFGDSLMSEVHVDAVPEPSLAGLTGAMLLALLCRRRRRR